jgi:NTP pyrophosphatase (non-canonical NTP hydrolase)
MEAKEYLKKYVEDAKRMEAKEYLKKYVEDAKRTESPNRKQIIFDPEALEFAIGMFIGAGNILDQIKKYVFYGKSIKYDELKKHLDLVNGSSEMLFDKERNDGSFAFNMDVIPVNDRLFHSVIGIATEATELIEAMKNGFLDENNLLDELGDCLWYGNLMVDELDSDWCSVLEKNIEKLRVRYPEKFTSEHAINRNLEEEKKVFNSIT